jgi:hypothetical protein
MTLISDTAFRVLLTVLTGGVAGVWLVHDAVCLARLARLREPRRDPLVADKRFGYAMGVVIGTIGVIGALRFNGVL